MDAEHMETLAEEFKACRKVLLALGDENRQHLLLEMMQMNRCGGARVGEITACTHLSRPAVSHHLQILKDAEILSVRREGMKNFYFFNPEAKGQVLIIAPEDTCGVDTLTRDKEALKRFYEKGYQDARAISSFIGNTRSEVQP